MPPAIQNWDAAYEEMLPKLTAIEQERQKGITTFIAVLSIGLVFAMGLGLVTQNFVIAIVIAVVSVIGAFIVQSAPNAGLNNKYKSVLKVLFEYVIPDIEYFPNNGISANDFLSFGIYSRQPDDFSSEDLFAGTRGKTNFIFCEVDATYDVQHTTTDSDGNTSTTTTTHTIFKGIIFKAEFHKDFKGHTIIRPSGFKLFTSDDLVKLENTEFEDKYDVYASDQQEARYLITHDWMQKLVDLHKNYLLVEGAAFLNNQMVLAMPFEKDRFDMSLWRTVLDKEKIKSELNLVNALVNLVDYFDLNVRIWSKE